MNAWARYADVTVIDPIVVSRARRAWQQILPTCQTDAMPQPQPPPVRAYTPAEQLTAIGWTLRQLEQQVTALQRDLQHDALIAAIADQGRLAAAFRTALHACWDLH